MLRALGFTVLTLAFSLVGWTHSALACSPLSAVLNTYLQDQDAAGIEIPNPACSYQDFVTGLNAEIQAQQTAKGQSLSGEEKSDLLTNNLQAAKLSTQVERSGYEEPLRQAQDELESGASPCYEKWVYRRIVRLQGKMERLDSLLVELESALDQLRLNVLTLD